MNLTSKYRLEQIRRRWWVVVAITLLGVLAGAAVAMQAQTTYTGKSTLILSGRTPDQDAVMVIGYVSIFNDPATFERLKAANGIPADIVVEARTAGASPILTVEATASDPEVAQDAAQKMAQAFSADINATPQSGRIKHLDDLQNRLNDVTPLAPDGSANPYYTALRTQIDEVQSDSTNELLGLQQRAGVGENAPKKMFTIVSGALGGLLLGLLAALGLAMVSPRMTNSADLRQKTGVEPLVEVPAGGSERRDKVRGERFRKLADIVSLEGLPDPSTVVIVDSGRGRGAREVAEALAKLSAQRGGRTLLVTADNDGVLAAKVTGHNDALTDVGVVRDGLTDGGVECFRMLPANAVRSGRYTVLARERVATILDELRSVADTIIIAAAPITDAAETPALCAAADATLIVVSKGSGRAKDVISVAHALGKAQARLLGAVLIGGSGGERPGQISDPSASRATERQGRPGGPRKLPQQSAGDRAAEATA